MHIEEGVGTLKDANGAESQIDFHFSANLGDAKLLFFKQVAKGQYSLSFLTRDGLFKLEIPIVVIDGLGVAKIETPDGWFHPFKLDRIAAL